MASAALYKRVLQIAFCRKNAAAFDHAFDHAFLRLKKNVLMYLRECSIECLAAYWTNFATAVGGMLERKRVATKTRLHYMPCLQRGVFTFQHEPGQIS